MACAEILTRSYLHVPRKFPFIGLTVGQLLYQTADKIPDREMFVFYSDKERITFKQMKEQSQQFAASLISKGMKKGDCMAFWGANHSEWLVALFACTQLGIIPVQFRLEFTQKSIAILLKKLRCKALLLTRSPNDLVDRACELIPELRDGYGGDLQSFPDLRLVIHGGQTPMKHFQNRCVCKINDFLKLGSKSDIENVSVICYRIDIDDPCLVYFTSNSAIFAATMSFASSASFAATLIPIVRGCTCVSPHPTYDVHTMAQALQDERVTEGVFFQYHITDLLNLPNLGDYDFSNLRIVSVGGSVIPKELFQKLTRIAKYGTILYGMTEIMAGFLSHPLDQHCTEAVYPLGGLEVKIVDKEGVIVPVNTRGEIWIRCYSALLYYMGNEEKTSEIKDSKEWIHTGDTGWMDNRGFIRVEDRIKDIIIKQGFNLSPSELEKVLSQHPDILGVMVVGVTDDRTEEVCACIRVKREGSPTPEDVREFCKEKVSTSLLVPKHVLYVEEFPTTETGKFARKKMKERAAEILATSQVK